MPIQICPNCQKETEVNPPYYRCQACQITLYAESINKDKEEASGNQVIIPQGLHANWETRPSIRHKIRLKKDPLPHERASAIPPKVEEKPISPTKEEEIHFHETQKEAAEPSKIEIPSSFFGENEQPKEEQKPVDKDIDDLMKFFEEAKKDDEIPIVPPQTPTILDTEPVSEEKKEENKDDLSVSFDNFNIVNEAKTPPKQEPSVSPPQKSPDDLLMWDVINELEERDKKLADFVGKPSKEKDNKQSRYLSQPTIPKIENKVAKKANKPEIAWLIRHTEGKEPVFYALYEGGNVIGKETTAIDTDVAISDDVYVSYGHATLWLHKAPPALWVYELYDDGSGRPDGKTSLNGTFVNGRTPRIIEPIFLQDGDTIQVGLTQFVFKTSDAKFPDMAKIIIQTLARPYVKIVKDIP